MTDVQTLAVAFSREVRATLTAEQLAAVNAVNKTPGYGPDAACASHDYIDANECMIAAFVAGVGREIDPDSQADADVTNAAWNMAKMAGFNPAIIGAPLHDCNGIHVGRFDLMRHPAR